jgi:hypothetical protein
VTEIIYGNAQFLQHNLQESNRLKERQVDESMTLSGMLEIYLACDLMGYISSDFLGDCQRFGITCCLILQDVREDGGNSGNQNTVP